MTVRSKYRYQRDRISAAYDNAVEFVARNCTVCSICICRIWQTIALFASRLYIRGAAKFSLHTRVTFARYAALVTALVENSSGDRTGPSFSRLSSRRIVFAPIRAKKPKSVSSRDRFTRARAHALCRFVGLKWTYGLLYITLVTSTKFNE